MQNYKNIKNLKNTEIRRLRHYGAGAGKTALYFITHRNSTKTLKLSFPHFRAILEQFFFPFGKIF